MSDHKKSLSRNHTARASVEFVGLAAAIAFIATGASANAVVESGSSQLRHEMSTCLNHPGEFEQPLCESNQNAASKSYRLAQQLIPCPPHVAGPCYLAD